MEQQVNRMRAKRGFVLPAVLLLALLGLLLGSGRLLLFKYQCQLRIDRQHELEKVQAVRSAMQRLSRCSTTSTKDSSILHQQTKLSFMTGSGRDVSVVVDPVEKIFPEDGNPSHFSIPLKRASGYSYTADAEGVDKGIKFDEPITSLYQLWMGETNVLQNATYRLRADMTGKGSWFEDLYGRRYVVGVDTVVQSLADATAKNDVIKLAIIRADGNWPIADHEKAIVLELVSYGASGGSQFPTNNVISLQTYENENGVLRMFQVTNLSNKVEFYNVPQNNALGIQLSGQKATLFYTHSPGKFNVYSFASSVGELSNQFYDYFTAGTITNRSGVVITPDLSMVLETTCVSRQDGSMLFGEANKFTKLEVWPAYEYEISVEHPHDEIKLATVVHLDMKARGTTGASDYRTAITYDTHGTDNKGWRRDEREAERKRNGQ